MKNKVVLITGGLNGIGKALAHKYYKNNKVIIIDNDIYSCSALKEKFPKIDIYIEDLTNSKEIKKIINNIFKRYGNVDILINNAAVQTIAEIDKLSIEEFKRVIDVNLNSNFYLTQIVSNKMKQKSTILNIISTHYNKPRSDHIHYDISKAGVAILTESFAKILADKKITINALAIGATYTNMNKEFEINKDLVNSTISRIPLKKICTPEDIANYAYNIIQDFSEETTGSIFVIDGGRNING